MRQLPVPLDCPPGPCEIILAPYIVGWTLILHQPYFQTIVPVLCILICSGSLPLSWRAVSDLALVPLPWSYLGRQDSTIPQISV